MPKTSLIFYFRSLSYRTDHDGRAAGAVALNKSDWSISGTKTQAKAGFEKLAAIEAKGERNKSKVLYCTTR
jgi:hypothetical protein